MNIARIRHRAGVTLILLSTLLWLLPTPLHAQEKAEENNEPHKIFLPVVTSASEPKCELNEQEAALDELMRTAPDQRRKNMACNPTLSAVARARAVDMAQRGYFGHVNPDGHGPNYLVLEAGYDLPGEYSTAASANNIESIGAGAADAAGMWNAWMNSPTHLTHLLGHDAFYAAQTDYGVGFARVPGSRYQYYWVFISSKPGQ